MVYERIIKWFWWNDNEEREKKKKDNPIYHQIPSKADTQMPTNFINWITKDNVEKMRKSMRIKSHVERIFGLWKLIQLQIDIDMSDIRHCYEKNDNKRKIVLWWWMFSMLTTFCLWDVKNEEGYFRGKLMIFV